MFCSLDSTPREAEPSHQPTARGNVPLWGTPCFKSSSCWAARSEAGPWPTTWPFLEGLVREKARARMLGISPESMIIVRGVYSKIPWFRTIGKRFDFVSAKLRPRSMPDEGSTRFQLLGQWFRTLNPTLYLNHQHQEIGRGIPKFQGFFASRYTLGLIPRPLLL